MTIDERISAELRRHAPEVDDHVAWDRIQSAAPVRRRARAMKLVAASLGSFVLVLLGFILSPYLSSDSDPAADAASPFLGTWVSSDLVDGTIATLVIRALEDGNVEMVMHDDVAFYQIVEDPLGWVCSGGAATTTGTGGLQAENELVFPAPVATCDDQPVEGLPPPVEVLESLTFTHDPGTDTLTDNLTDNSETIWTRVDAELTSPWPIWPQTNLEEVREAQELADAGNPDYIWQLGGDQWYQPSQSHTNDSELFARFLEEELGWEEFLWDHAVPHSEGVSYIRCAPGLTNPLYPTDPKGSGCAPTLDELRYETVKIRVAQLAGQGPSGIWVVTGWEIVEPFAQADPRVVEAEATALLEDFLQARIDGEGAEGLADLPEDHQLSDELADREVPLLYSTSSGARYERSEFELVDRPVWPSGWMQFEVRLFAQGDDTVVEQVFSLERDETGRMRPVYNFEHATTQNGMAVPVEYGFLDGEVTYRAASPLEPSDDGYREWDRLAIVGLLPDDDAPRRVLLFLADPRPIGPDCVEAPAPADAEALARSIGSDPDFEATAPVEVTIGGTPALQMDVVLARGASSCSWSEPGIPSESSPLLLKHAPMFLGHDRARLYLVDLPGGSVRVLTMAMITDEDSFETVLPWAASIVDSIEIHTS